jgi:glyoxylase-like metal-dependent hydrolase (beta-lactamase superfamily II)
MKQVADQVFQVGSKGHNFYILKEGDTATLIDAGCSGEWLKLLGALDELGLGLESIVGIVAAHSHADHFGLAKQAQAEGISVAVHEDEESRALGTYTGRYAVGTFELPFWKFSMYRNFLPMLRAGVMKLDHADEIDTFSDGDRLDLPGSPIAVHTPGHTEGHVMFHCPQLGLLFSGDGLITMDLVGSGVGPQMIESKFNFDSSQALTSLDRVVGIEANLLLPGHGQPWKGTLAEAVQTARS